MTRHKEHQKTYEKGRIERYNEYNKETSKQKLTEQQKKEILGPLVAVQSNLEDSIMKANKIYNNYDEYKQGYQMNEDSSDEDGNHQKTFLTQNLDPKD
jgi:hypothetical protein